MKASLILLVSTCLAAAPASPPPEPADPPSVRDIYEHYVSELSDEVKAELLSWLARTAPVTTRDVQSLNDLFMRFPSRPVRAAARIKVVCRARNAGIWMISSTRAAGFTSLTQCTSEITGIPNLLFIFLSIFKPLTKPGPR